MLALTMLCWIEHTTTTRTGFRNQNNNLLDSLLRQEGGSAAYAAYHNTLPRRSVSGVWESVTKPVMHLTDMLAARSDKDKMKRVDIRTTWRWTWQLSDLRLPL